MVTFRIQLLFLFLSFCAFGQESETVKTYVQQTILESKLPVLVDFSATWCGPCRLLAPRLEDVKGQLTGKVKVVQFDADRNRAMFDFFEIQYIPALFVYRDGKKIDALEGYSPEKFDAFIKKNFSQELMAPGSPEK